MILFRRQMYPTKKDEIQKHKISDVSFFITHYITAAYADCEFKYGYKNTQAFASRGIQFLEIKKALSYD